MRQLFYKVKGSDKLIASYFEALEMGKIIDTVLIEVDERTEKQKKEAREHCRKVYEAYGIGGKK